MLQFHGILVNKNNSQVASIHYGKRHNQQIDMKIMEAKQTIE